MRPEQMAFFHLVATCQLSLADMPLTWLQAGEKYREWLVDQEGDEIKIINCYKVTNTYLSRPWRGKIKYPGGRAQESMRVGVFAGPKVHVFRRTSSTSNVTTTRIAVGVVASGDQLVVRFGLSAARWGATQGAERKRSSPLFPGWLTDLAWFLVASERLSQSL
jgi:transposase